MVITLKGISVWATLHECHYWRKNEQFEVGLTKGLLLARDLTSMSRTIWSQTSSGAVAVSRRAKPIRCWSQFGRDLKTPTPKDVWWLQGPHDLGFYSPRYSTPSGSAGFLPLISLHPRSAVPALHKERPYRCWEKSVLGLYSQYLVFLGRVFYWVLLSLSCTDVEDTQLL